MQRGLTASAAPQSWVPGGATVKTGPGFAVLISIVLLFPALPSFAQQSESSSTDSSGLNKLPPEQRGDLLMVRRQYAAAITAYNQALESPVLWNKLGTAYHHLLAFSTAQKYYDRALRIQPAFPEALNNLGTCYFESHDYLEAVHYYQRSLRLSPGSAPTLVNLGTAWFALGRSREGSDAYRQALAANPHIFDDDRLELVESPAS